MFKIVNFLYFIFVFSTISFAQDYNCNVQKNWFFGRGLTSSGGYSGEVVHMQFQCPSGIFASALPVASVTPYGHEGTGVINDMNTGAWQLYSDGDNVIYPVSPSISGLGGHASSAQSIAIAAINICPVDSFYIFSNSTGSNNFGNISYSLGTGTTSPVSQTSLQMPASSQIGNATNLNHGEGMLIVPNSIILGNYWLITRLLKNNGSSATDAFVVYEVSSSGVSIHQIFNMATDGNTNISNSILSKQYTNFTFNLERKEMAVADANISKSIFTIPFNPSTGNFSGTIENVISLTTLGAYDSEYSPNNQYLYYSKYSTGEVFAYDLNMQTSMLIFQTPSGPIKRGTGLATGPDGNIYSLTVSTGNWSVFDSEIWQITNPNIPSPISTSFMNFDNWLMFNFPNFAVLNEFELYSNMTTPSICPSDSLKLGFKTDFSLNTGTNFTWYLDGVVIPGETDSTLWAQEVGTYLGEVNFSGGCTYKSIEIEILPLLDLAISIASYSCDTDTVEIEVCNYSDTSYSGSIDISFYDNDPLSMGANIILTQQVTISIDSNNCQSYFISLPLTTGDLYVVLNDPGTIALPLLISDFPLNGIEECDYTNNISVENIVCCPNNLEVIDTVFCHTDPNINMVVNSIINGDINWYSDNSYTQLLHNENTYTPNDSVGNYTFFISETTLFCTILDSIELIINPTPSINAGVDYSICSNDTLVLLASNPSNAILTWDSGVTDGIAFVPQNTQMYTVTANLNMCYSTDSIYIDLLTVPLITSNLSETICEGDSVLITLDNPDNALITWSPNLSVGDFLIPVIGSVTYSVTGNLNNCMSSDSFNIIVNPTPIIDAGIDYSICSNDTLVLIANNPSNAILTWDNGVTDGIAFVPLNAQMYTVTANLNMCYSTDSIYIDLLTVPLITSNLSETICEGDSVLITLDNPDNALINWNPNISLGDYLTPSVGAITYIVTGNLNNCINTDTFNIVVNAYPVLNLNPDVVVCDGTQIALTGASNLSLPLIWNNGIETSVSFLPSLGTTYYTASIDNNGCSVSDSVLVVVNPNPSFSSTITQSNTCSQVLGSVEFIELSSGFGPFVINGPNGVSPSLFYDSLTLGNHLFTITDVNGCQFSNTINYVESITFDYEAEFSYSPFQVTTTNSEVIFQNVTTNAIDYAWYNSYDNSVANSEEYTINFPQVEGEYEVCLVANFGGSCLDTTCIIINVLDELLLFVPNAFTPNGGHINSQFTPIFSNSSKVVDYHLIIFNRWGETVFESYNPNIGWNGTYDGSLVQDAVYIWQIEYRANDSSEKKLKRGHITVLK